RPAGASPARRGGLPWSFELVLSRSAGSALLERAVAAARVPARARLEVEAHRIDAGLDRNAERRDGPAEHHVIADGEDEVHHLALVEVLAEKIPGLVADALPLDQLVDRAQ